MDYKFRILGGKSMKIEEAIEHCEEVAKEKLNCNACENCKKCAEEHKQIALWLKELLEFRKQ